MIAVHDECACVTHRDDELKFDQMRVRDSISEECSISERERRLEEERYTSQGVYTQHTSYYNHFDELLPMNLLQCVYLHHELTTMLCHVHISTMMCVPTSMKVSTRKYTTCMR